MTADSKKRAENILAKTMSARKRTNWYSMLSVDRQRVVKAVANTLSERPDIAVRSVAKTLMREMNLTVNEETISRTLVKMMQDAKKS